MLREERCYKSRVAFKFLCSTLTRITISREPLKQEILRWRRVLRLHPTLVRTVVMLALSPSPTPQAGDTNARAVPVTKTPTASTESPKHPNGGTRTAHRTRIENAHRINGNPQTGATSEPSPERNCLLFPCGCLPLLFSVLTPHPYPYPRYPSRWPCVALALVLPLPPLP